MIYLPFFWTQNLATPHLCLILQRTATVSDSNYKRYSTHFASQTYVSYWNVTDHFTKEELTKLLRKRWKTMKLKHISHWVILCNDLMITSVWIILIFDFFSALSIEDRYKYFARLLKTAVDGVGTDEDRIHRIVLNTCETYLGDILEEYECLFEKKFIKRIEGFKVIKNFHRKKSNI